MHACIQTLHNEDNASRNWLKSIDTRLKTINTRLRRLQLLSEQDPARLGGFQEILLEYTARSEAMAEKIFDWIENVKFMDETYSMSDIESMLTQAQGK